MLTVMNFDNESTEALLTVLFCKYSLALFVTVCISYRIYWSYGFPSKLTEL